MQLSQTSYRNKFALQSLTIRLLPQTDRFFEEITFVKLECKTFTKTQKRGNKEVSLRMCSYERQENVPNAW
jgi:hypothetical protein